VWLIQSLCVVLAGYCASLALCKDRGFSHRAVVWTLLSTTSVLVSILLPGLTHALTATGLSLVAFFVTAAMVICSLSVVPAIEMKRQFRQDLTLPRILLLEALKERELALFGVLLGAVAVAIACLRIWYFKTWNWDSVWYHTSITNFAIQNHSVWAPDTHDVFIRGFPRNAELLGVWNCLLPHDARLDDSIQIPFAVLGMTTVMAWCRKLGASRPLSLGLGCLWVTLPPIFIQLDSSQNDIVCGASLSAAFYFGTGKSSRLTRWLMLLSLAWYAGTKTSGLVYIVMLAPWLFIRWILEWRQAQLSTRVFFVDTVGSLTALLFVGGLKYVENAIFEHNPTYPFPLHVPLVNWSFAGPADLFSAYQLDSGHTLGLFFQKAAWGRLLGAWFFEPAAYWPDVRTGGFGFVFRWVLLPCFVVLALSVPFRRKQWRALIPLVCLFVASLCIPAPWWPRYTIGLAASVLVSVAAVSQMLPAKLLKALLSTALVGCAAYTLWFTETRREGPPTRRSWAVAESSKSVPSLGEAMTLSAVERHSMTLSGWSWPVAWGEWRTRELTSGSVIAVDEHTEFMAEYWRHDLTNQVQLVSYAKDPATFIERIYEANARWVAVAAGEHESAVRRAGGTFLFAPPVAHALIFEMPRRP
jgi:hypothetical protein